MSDLQRAAQLAMGTKLLADVVRDESAAARQVLAERMAESGSERVRVSDSAGASVGTVSVVNKAPTAQVTDPKAFADWAKQRYPEAVHTSVDPVWTDRLLRGATAKGAPVDPEGEVIPGVEIVTPEPYLTVRPTAEARDRMRTMLANSGLLALPAGGEPS